MYKMVNGEKIAMNDAEIAEVQALWAASEAAKAQAANPLNKPLNAVQFHAMLGILGKTEAVASAVEALDEPARSVARARINYSQQFRRNHPLFAQLSTLVGVTDAEIDAAWPQALAIE